ncbi:MAG: hypothetical protein LBT30_05160 [Clostridiales bacterium]|jgi:hypothetical protein|nr:hypothetical protein [Clostridiales bacterium]
MIIIKNEKNYSVFETKTKWKISIVKTELSIDYNISKKDIPTFEALKEYILSEDIF